MKFLLDTNAMIAVLKSSPNFLSRMRQYQPTDFGMPVTVVHELYFGAYRSTQVARNLVRIEEIQFEVLDFDAEDARQAGEIRAALAAADTPIGPYDAMIAGQAVARGLTLVTHNTREFRRVLGLVVEDWE
ncbi:MAG: type II toxin-antitoxin system VapC family toxin [Acetobacteraceae bacterium]|nr:type II toxin-antitoxin system VapC family toxin [Acetobacteraceae bacterium]